MADWDDDEWDVPDLNQTAGGPPETWSDEEGHDAHKEEARQQVIAVPKAAPAPPKPLTGLAAKIAPCTEVFADMGSAPSTRLGAALHFPVEPCQPSVAFLPQTHIPNSLLCTCHLTQLQMLRWVRSTLEKESGQERVSARKSRGAKESGRESSMCVKNNERDEKEGWRRFEKEGWRCEDKWAWRGRLERALDKWAWRGRFAPSHSLTDSRTHPRISPTQLTQEREAREAEEARQKEELRKKLGGGDDDDFEGLEGEALEKARS
eukprot:6192560-Pleurochrysis_carterae.AAC.1